MIGRWFDTRELRRALRLSEEARRDLAVKVAQARRERDEALALVERLEAGRDALVESYEKQRVRANLLADRLDDLQTADRVAGEVAQRHAEVSVLPPALVRDREGLYRLEAENARLRTQVENLLAELKEQR